MTDIALFGIIGVGSIFVLLLILIVYFMKMDTIIRAKFKSMISHKPYGVAYFHLANLIYPKMVRFDESAVEMKNGKFSISGDAIYIQKEVNGKKEEKTFKLTEFITHQQGIPTIHFDYDVGIPIKFGKYDSATIPNPKQIQATYKKELEYDEAELMYHSRDKVRKLLLVGIIMTVMVLCVLAYDTMKITEIASLVAK